jgi:Spy/CpxP family protein refolding chaperone
MKARWMVALVAAAGLLAAVAAHAADTAKKAPAAPGQPGSAGMQAPVGGHDDMDMGMGLDDEGDDDAPMGGMAHMGMGHMGGMGHMRGMGRMGGGPGMRHGGMGRGFAMLDLTDDQREKLKAVHEKQQRRDVQARADLEIARMDLRDLVQAEKPNTSAINAQIDKMAKLQAERRKAQVGTLLEARALLTPEQQKKLREMRFKGPGGMPGMQGTPGKQGQTTKPGEGM